MATLLGERVGDTVGYVTRDERVVGPATRIQVVTDGILTRRLQRDPELAGVGLVIFDEFHERSLQADLGLALSLHLRRTTRTELRLLVMSATLDDTRVAALLGAPASPAPIVASEARSFPVAIEWQPRRRTDRLEPAVAAAVGQALAGDGDVLVFLPGVGEIRRSVEHLTATLPAGAGVDVVALYGALSGAEQDRALAPAQPGRRKVVVATDVAETSVTVPGVSTVVDAGLARTPRFDPRTGMTRLVTGAASRASADQRAGRAGRTAPGVAIRLWSRVEHGTRPRFSAPEITQVDLAGIALELAAAGVDPGGLPWLDPPPARTLHEGCELLARLGALGDDGRLTAVGDRMAGLPLHPRLARMVLAGNDLGAGWTACIAAALLDDRDVLRGPPDALPADLAVRVALVDDSGRRHPLADGRALRNARDRAEELARRIGTPRTSADPELTGLLLAAAYPDRIAVARSGAKGRYRLMSGSGVWLAATDPLAQAALVVAADLDGQRKEARVRLGAALSADDLELVPGLDVARHEALVWDRARDELVVRVEHRVGNATLSSHDARPAPGPAVVEALLDRVRRRGIASLPWSESARKFRDRVGFVAAHRPDLGLPALDDATLAATLESWLAPYLVAATGRDHLDALELGALLEAQLSWDQAVAVAELAPARLDLHSGRSVPVRYDGPVATVAARVQLFYGCRDVPRVLGGVVPVVLELLSPAERPIQVTSDLAGFWAGSWREVRKDMAGRYPKHEWPERPDLATG
jgi:ATP-dependent helicase HrpB